METFLSEKFLLSTPTARKLYHEYAEHMPIIDYHCHIDPAEIANDRRYDNITQLWLAGDHYKWRQMRAFGVPERLITGDGSDYEKFIAFANVLPHCIGNPLYHWTHLELKRYFDCDIPLSGDSADEIWALCNKKLQSDLTVRKIIAQSNVTGLATTDDPIDTLEYHAALANDPTFHVTVKPAWRPDKLLNIGAACFGAYIEQLGQITSMETLRAAVLKRMDYFDKMGCSASDHGIRAIEYIPATESELNAILAKGMAGESVTQKETMAYQYAMLRFMATEYARRGWVMEVHYGTLRNINSMRFETLGPDTGYDAIAADVSVSGLPHLLDELYRMGSLPRTILFSLNPSDNAMLNTIAGCFQAEGMPGLVQQGTAWWFNDTKSGMIEQMTNMANLFPLSCFIGMVTDSRSFLSYTRHEYFRRILCDLLGNWVENGEYPADYKLLKEIVQNICYHNTKLAFLY